MCKGHGLLSGNKLCCFQGKGETNIINTTHIKKKLYFQKSWGNATTLFLNLYTDFIINFLFFLNECKKTTLQFPIVVVMTLNCFRFVRNNTQKLKQMQFMIIKDKDKWVIPG